MQRSTLTLLIAVWATAGALAPLANPAAVAPLAIPAALDAPPVAAPAPREMLDAFQDPPVIPRSLLKRGSDRPQRFVRTELFFGTATPGQSVTEELFLAFLDAEVTPRFPDGLTLFKGHGRFTGKDGVLVKEDPFMVILLHPYERFSTSNRKIEEIRQVYKTRFQQESVLRVDYQFSVRVSF